MPSVYACVVVDLQRFYSTFFADEVTIHDILYQYVQKLMFYVSQ